ncbi:hypothetical protein ACLOJK_003617 [Asimina triloba]
MGITTCGAKVSRAKVDGVAWLREVSGMFFKDASSPSMGGFFCGIRCDLLDAMFEEDFIMGSNETIDQSNFVSKSGDQESDLLTWATFWQ